MTATSHAEEQLTAFLDFVDRELGLDSVQTVIEAGARDGVETAELSRRLPNASIYAFECNPSTLPACREAIEALPNAHLVERAVADHDGDVTFYPIDPDLTETSWKDGNPGASSLFRASGKYPVERYVQGEVTVKATTLATFLDERRIPCVDLLWMDIQGAEQMALAGLGERIHDVKAIHAELEFLEIYADQPLFADIRRFLGRRGFRLAAFTSVGPYAADAIFLNAKSPTGARRRLSLYARDLRLRLVGRRQRLRRQLRQLARRDRRPD